LINAQRSTQNIDGYYFPNDELAEKSMRPSKTFNSIIDTF